MPARSLLQAPLLDPLHAVVHNIQAPMVCHVPVYGRLVVRDGASTVVDEPALIVEAEAACTAWLQRLGLPAAPAGAWFAASAAAGS